MGKCSSKKWNPVIDVSGNNNYVLLLNGIQVSFASILREITNHIDSTNHIILLVICLGYALTIILMIILVIYIVRLTKHRSTQYDIILRNIEDDIARLNSSIEKIAFPTDHSTMPLLSDKTDRRPDYNYVNEHPEFAV